MRKFKSIAIFILVIDILILCLVVTDQSNKIQQLEIEIQQETKVPEGFNVVKLDLNGYTGVKTTVGIQSISEEQKSLRTYVVSRGDVSRKQTSVVTAYTWTGNKTAIGTYPVQGRTCAGPRWIPLGTVVYIEGVGERIVEDRTHIRFNGRYDVYMDSEDACWQFGKQNLKVEVLR